MKSFKENDLVRRGRMHIEEDYKCRCGFFAVTVGKEGNDSFFHFLLSMSHRLLILSFGLAGGIPFWSSSCNS